MTSPKRTTKAAREITTNLRVSAIYDAIDKNSEAAATLIAAGLASDPGNYALGMAALKLVELQPDDETALSLLEALCKKHRGNPVLDANLANMLRWHEPERAYSLVHPYVLGNKKLSPDHQAFKHTYNIFANICTMFGKRTTQAKQAINQGLQAIEYLIAAKRVDYHSEFVHGKLLFLQGKKAEVADKVSGFAFSAGAPNLPIALFLLTSNEQDANERLLQIAKIINTQNGQLTPRGKVIAGMMEDLKSGDFSRIRSVLATKTPKRPGTRIERQTTQFTFE